MTDKPIFEITKTWVEATGRRLSDEWILEEVQDLEHIIDPEAVELLASILQKQIDDERND